MKIFTDEEIKTYIVDHLSWNTMVDASSILVSVNNGFVTIAGTVKSQTEKQQAFESARHVSGVRGVNNEIIVFHSPGKEPVTDSELLTSIERAFKWNPLIDEKEIKVQVIEGLVTLTGCLRHYSQRLKAETIVSELAGVRGVVNELSIVCTDEIKDDLILKAIMDEISNTDPEAAGKIRITVNNGFVEISGGVDSYMSEKRVFDVVSHTNGVTGIRNNLEILVNPDV